MLLLAPAQRLPQLKLPYFNNIVNTRITFGGVSFPTSEVVERHTATFVAPSSCKDISSDPGVFEANSNYYFRLNMSGILMQPCDKDDQKQPALY